MLLFLHYHVPPPSYRYTAARIVYVRAYNNRRAHCPDSRTPFFCDFYFIAYTYYYPSTKTNTKCTRERLLHCTTMTLGHHISIGLRTVGCNTRRLYSKVYNIIIVLIIVIIYYELRETRVCKKITIKKTAKK